MTQHFETVQEVTRELKRVLQNRNLIEAFPEALELLTLNSGNDLALPVAGNPGGGWSFLIARLLSAGLSELQIIALERYYGLQCEEQRALGHRYHKGYSLHNIGAAYLALGQPIVARRYITLAYIEDVLSHGVDTGGMAQPVLFAVVGVPRKELDDLTRFADGHRQPTANPHPEDVLLAFQQERMQSRDWESRLFHPNLVFAQELLNGALSEEDSVEKGLAMERLVAYLLTCIAGLELAEFRLKAKDHETDLLIRNGVRGDPLFEVFGSYLGVECKNWDRSVGVQEVNHFIANLRFAYLNSGILVARTGISGGKGQNQRNAELAVLKAFHQDNIIVCVITISDLEKVVQGQLTMPGLLLAEYERIRFDKTTR